ncbi:MAG: hypothetical protein J4432_03105 [DPANN group archaeon]|nr:hypothetical protein [DPANN group archaeon]
MNTKTMSIKKILGPIFLFPFFAARGYAHCPLCTAGIVAAAGGATLLGVKTPVIGLFIGAFAISTGLWAAKLIKKQLLPFQTHLLAITSLALTVSPMLAFFGGDFHPIYVSLAGDYGSLLNSTYLLDKFIASSVIGGAVVYASPGISKKITQLRGKHIPYQGIALTLLLLIAIGTIIQFTL